VLEDDRVLDLTPGPAAHWHPAGLREARSLAEERLRATENVVEAGERRRRLAVFRRFVESLVDRVDVPVGIVESSVEAAFQLTDRTRGRA
jgi:hypothetical protein